MGQFWQLATSPNKFLSTFWRQPHVPLALELVEHSDSSLERWFSQIAPPSKFTRRQSLYHHTGPVEALEHRLALTDPTANPGGPYLISAEESLNLDGTMSQVSDPADVGLGIYKYDWTINGKSVPAPPGPPPIADPMPSIPWSVLSAPTTGLFSGYGLAKGVSDNTYTIDLTVWQDSTPIRSGSASTTVTVLANIPPTANAGGPYSMTGTASSSIELNGSGSSDPDDMFPNYSWDMEPFGSIDYTGSSKTLTWADLYALGFRGGTSKQVKLIVNDGLASDDDITTITVVNTGPIADAGPAFSPETEYVIEFGDALTLDASGSVDEDQGPADPVTYDWDIDNDGTYDGTYDETGETVTVSWADLSTLYGYSAGIHTVKLKVSDSDVPKDGTDTVTVRVKPPMVSVSITSNMREHSSSFINGTITFTRSGPATAALNGVTISLGGSATMAPAANADYSNIPMTIDFAAGSPTTPISVTIFNDSFVEGSETIIVALTGGSPTTYEFDSTAGPATGTIEDMDRWRWKTFSGTPVSASPPPHIWSDGDSLTFNGSVTATNSSVQTSVSGSYITGPDDAPVPYSVNGGVNLGFNFDEVTGAITASTGVPENPYEVLQHGPLKGAAPIAWTIDNTAHTATVTVSGLGVVVGGDVSITGGVDAGVVATLSTTTPWGIAFSLPTVVITLGLEIYEATP